MDSCEYSADCRGVLLILWLQRMFTPRSFP